MHYCLSVSEQPKNYWTDFHRMDRRDWNIRWDAVVGFDFSCLTIHVFLAIIMTLILQRCWHIPQVDLMLKHPPQGLWFANPGGSNSMPSRTHSSVQRTRSLPVHTTPQTMVMFQQSGKKCLATHYYKHTTLGGCDWRRWFAKFIYIILYFIYL